METIFIYKTNQLTLLLKHAQRYLGHLGLHHYDIKQWDFALIICVAELNKTKTSGKRCEKAFSAKRSLQCRSVLLLMVKKNPNQTKIQTILA